MPNMAPPKKPLREDATARLRRAVERAGLDAPSLLVVTAAKYGARWLDTATPDDGDVDPAALRLFEAIVEGAYLVAAADGDFDAAERAAFAEVMRAACGEKVSGETLHAVVADLSDLLAEDGMEKRVKMIARSISEAEQAREVLRIATLIAQVSQGVSDVERRVLDCLAAELGLGGTAVDDAVRVVEQALSE
jgi:tellurite resistance protein